MLRLRLVACLSCLLLLGAATSLVRAVRAGDEPAEPEAGPPPELPTGRDAYLAPHDAEDWRRGLGAIRDQIDRFETAPPSTEDVTALKDAWQAILQPRVKRMLRRIDRWQKPQYWVTDDKETPTTTLDPGAWTTFTRDMAALATEIHGAMVQYGRVQLRPKHLGGGTLYEPSPPRVVLAYPYATLYGSVLDRQAAAQALGRWGSRSYWHLLDRFWYAWDWSWQRRLAWYQYWNRRQQATDQLFEDLRADLDATRESLGSTLLGLQVFVAALQNAEEERLRDQCFACRSEDATLREMGETALDAMAAARLEAERYQGDSSAAYGTLLRNWLRAQKAAVKVMEVANEALDASTDEAGADESGGD